MRARFTTDQIASAALRIVDESGPSALSMRALAGALGTGPMTMYNYVADKEGLEELVVAAVAAGIEVPAATADWAADVHTMAFAMWRGVRAHPAAIPMVLTRRMTSSTGFAIVDAIIEALSRAGLSDQDRLSAFHAVLGLVTGSAQAQLAGPFSGDSTETATRIGLAAGAQYPHIAALSTVAATTSVEADFGSGLQMLIAGIGAAAR